MNVAADIGALRPPPPDPDERDASDRAFVLPPRETMIGALLRYVTHADRKDRQPMNAAFGLLPPHLGRRLPRRERKALHSSRGLEAMARWSASLEESRRLSE